MADKNTKQQPAAPSSPTGPGATQFQPSPSQQEAPEPLRYAEQQAPLEMEVPSYAGPFIEAEPPPGYGNVGAEIIAPVFDPRARVVDPEVRPGYAPQSAPANRIVNPEVTGALAQRRAQAIIERLPPPWVLIRVFVLRDEPHVRINNRTFCFQKGTDADIEWPLVAHLSAVGIVGSTDPVARAREEYAKIQAGNHVIVRQ